MRRTRTALLMSAMPLGFAPSLQAQPIYTDVAREVGIDFVHDPGAEGKHMAPEVMGSGSAFFDYDNDGDLDIYLVQAGPLPESGKARPPDRLYRQESGGKFTDATAESGVGDTGYGTGVAVGDIDNDGFVDLYVGNYGPDSLYRNLGNGKFENVTARAGISGSFWTASAVFCDYDADGFLDLYVTHYVKFDPTKVCVKGDGAPDYCSPQSLPYETDRLYHNRGNGTFTDVSRAAGISAARLPGLGVLCADFTGDGLLDFYVANDGEANNLWVNLGKGKFEDQAFLMGAAVSAMGRPQASMGVALGDIDSDSDLDLFMTHLINDYNTLYVNDGRFGFEDRSAAAGLVAPSLPFTGFGTAFVDYEHDGDLDIVVVNGAVDRHKPYPGARMSEHWNRYAEPKHLYQNDGTGRFQEISKDVGPFATDVDLSRGLSVGDVDGDGDLDLLVNDTAGPARLYRNDARKQGGYLLVRAWDESRKRDAHGAVVTVTASGKAYVRVADPAFSYLSSNDPRAHFGIPGATRAEGIRVRWPDGTEEAFPGVALNQSIVLKKSQGKPSSN
jgi:enediyne biosynthesis protein E4